jgi:hypothetical protein
MRSSQPRPGARRRPWYNSAVQRPGDSTRLIRQHVQQLRADLVPTQPKLRQRCSHAGRRRGHVGGPAPQLAVTQAREEMALHCPAEAGLRGGQGQGLPSSASRAVRGSGLEGLASAARRRADHLHGALKPGAGATGRLSSARSAAPAGHRTGSLSSSSMEVELSSSWPALGSGGRCRTPRVLGWRLAAPARRQCWG